MDASIGDLGLPGGQLHVEVVNIVEGPARREVALDVLHARLDLALGLGAIRLAQTRCKSPVVREGIEGRVELRPAIPRAIDGAADDHRPHAIVEQRLAAAAEVGEGVLVRGPQVRHAFMQEAFGVPASAEAERHHEDVDLGRNVGEANRDLAPVDLRLLARAGLEAALRQCPRSVHRPAADGPPA